jgi:hypothetical protein
LKQEKKTGGRAGTETRGKRGREPETKTERQVTKQGERTGESALDWETQETHRQKKEHKQRKVTETVATAFGVSRTKRESKGKQKKEQRRGGSVGQPELRRRLHRLQQTREHILLLALFQLAFTLCK